jgi:beta-phosphoglucomutase-like phosphatase (HAD superfamily)
MSSLPDLGASFRRADFDGFIFDCDGTLADSMPLHYRAWTESLAEKLGRPATEFTESLFYHFGGMPARRIVERLNQDFGYNLPPEKTAHDKEIHFLKLLPGVGPVPEVVAVMQSLGPGAKVIVASGGLTGIVRDTLKHVGIEVGPDHIVQEVIGSDQVERGKPHPDLFLHAAKALGVPPARCLVFEDAEPGFAAARAAGMQVIDVRPFRAGLSDAARY